MLKLLKSSTVLVAIITMFIVISPTYAGLDDQSLVLYLSFDEGNGATAKDGSVHGNDGELFNDPKWVDGKFGGNALEFDGGNQTYVMVPINDTLQLREQFTVAFWAKRGDAQIREWNYMVSAGSLVWATIFNNNNKKTYLYSKDPGWSPEVISEVDQPEDWVHITLTHDTESEVALYFDGERVGTGDNPAQIIEIDGSIMVGARHPGQEFYSGVIDEVYLFNRVITEAEMNTIINGDFTPVEPAKKLATTWGTIKADRRE